MAAQRRAVRKHDVVADDAVMGDVTVGHEEAAVADRGDAAAVLGAEIHRDAFAQVASGADDEAGRAAAIARRLRRRAERDERIDHGAGTDRRVAGEVHVGDQPAAVADDDMGPDHAIGADRDILADRRAGRDAGGCIDCGHAGASAVMAPTSASATSWPATLASPRNHHIMRRWLILVTWYSTVSPGVTGLRNFALSMVMK